MNTYKIAKQLPFKILVKRILKRLFPKKPIDYAAKDSRVLNSKYSINSLLNSSAFISNFDEVLISGYLKHQFDLLGSGLVSRNSVNDLKLNKEHQLFSDKEEVLIENIIVRQLSNNSRLSLLNKKSESKFQVRNTIDQIQKPITTEIKFPKRIELDKINFFAYKEFGIYGFKSDDFYLCISAISNKEMHHSWSHVHNDKLSFDLQIKGKDLVKDPGTYTYSAFPEKREFFRNSKSHNGIVVKGIEQNKGLGPFYLEREVGCEILEIKDLSITLQAKYYGVIHTRKFKILSDQLVVTDYCNKPFKVNINKFKSYSPNYGSILEIR